ncbi:MAG: cytochrome c [Vicinamibacterales bacterium]
MMKPSAGLSATLLFVVGTTPLSALFAQPAPQTPRTVWDGVYTSAQAARGEAEYNRYCSSCHMPDLLGNPTHPPGQPPTRTFTGVRSGTPPLRGAQFVANWTGLTLSDLFTRNRVSMPQAAPGSLSRQQNADILAYILSQNGYPAGTTELPRDDAPLAEFRIVQ